MNLPLRLVRSRDNLKQLYRYYYSTYGHQTWQAGDLTWVAFTHIVNPLFGRMVVRDHVPN